MALNWLWKRLGYHVCEEFTQWETYEGKYSRPTSYEQDGSIWIETKKITFTRRWQERRCTICGRLEQRDLKQ
jgi:hypothetical protein